MVSVCGRTSVVLMEMHSLRGQTSPLVLKRAEKVLQLLTVVFCIDCCTDRQENRTTLIPSSPKEACHHFPGRHGPSFVPSDNRVQGFLAIDFGDRKMFTVCFNAFPFVVFRKNFRDPETLQKPWHVVKCLSKLCE
ncbi:hypothetical protein NPIL_440011 [Nephila pilipes]|uniref:Uncharacterized protein n=1 Tax=Nephila pilipes TaxID=299642 RepID=A0A8X6PPF6_NEPPI|nr:hypothetical protein NPIL_440011 [Nephila pilipes]